MPSQKTKNFFYIFLLAILFANLTVLIYKQHETNVENDQGWTLFTGNTVIKNQTLKNQQGTLEQPEKIEPKDTTTWDVYRDPDNTFAFKYPSGWIVKSDYTKAGVYPVTILVKPTEKSSGFKITLSKDSFVGFDGYATVATTIDGQPAINAKNYLYGVKIGDIYYSMDIGALLDKTEEFYTLVSSFRF